MENPYAPPGLHVTGLETRSRLTLLQWIGRGLAGLLLGWAWSSLVMGSWLGLAAACYGGIQEASDTLVKERWGLLAVSSWGISTFGSLVGSLVATVMTGAARVRVRRPILVASFCGALIAAGVGTGLGLVVGLICRPLPSDEQTAFVIATISAIAMAGLLGGGLGYRVVIEKGPAISARERSQGA